MFFSRNSWYLFQLSCPPIFILFFFSNTSIFVYFFFKFFFCNIIFGNFRLCCFLCNFSFKIFYKNNPTTSMYIYLFKERFTVTQLWRSQPGLTQSLSHWPPRSSAVFVHFNRYFLIYLNALFMIRLHTLCFVLLCHSFTMKIEFLLPALQLQFFFSNFVNANFSP